MHAIDGDQLMQRLEELRQNLTEDAVLDLMDEVEGWCSPHRRLGVIADAGFDEPLPA